jgi:hypothetical protein
LALNNKYSSSIIKTTVQYNYREHFHKVTILIELTTPLNSNKQKLKKYKASHVYSMLSTYDKRTQQKRSHVNVGRTLLIDTTHFDSTHFHNEENAELEQIF